MSGDIDARIEALRRSDRLPAHVAIIMDGNGRWAKRRHLPRLAGHRAGREPVRTCVRTCARLGIPYLTLYTFSLENWLRPENEVRGLMRFLEDTLESETLELDENGVRLEVIGRVDMLPPATRAALDRARERLAKNSRLCLTLALSYGGRAEIVDAARRIADDIAGGALDPDDVDEAALRERLYAPWLPDPDLLIRTSGELRVSNFLLFQIAYTEIWVTDTLWPDFDAGCLLDAIEDFTRRERRYGRSD